MGLIWAAQKYSSGSGRPNPPLSKGNIKGIFPYSWDLAIPEEFTNKQAVFPKTGFRKLGWYGLEKVQEPGHNIHLNDCYTPPLVMMYNSG